MLEKKISFSHWQSSSNTLYSKKKFFPKGSEKQNYTWRRTWQGSTPMTSCQKLKTKTLFQRNKKDYLKEPVCLVGLLLHPGTYCWSDSSSSYSKQRSAVRRRLTQSSGTTGETSDFLIIWCNNNLNIIVLLWRSSLNIQRKMILPSICFVLFI